MHLAQPFLYPVAQMSKSQSIFQVAAERCTHHLCMAGGVSVRGAAHCGQLSSTSQAPLLQEEIHHCCQRADTGDRRSLQLPSVHVGGERRQV